MALTLSVLVLLLALALGAWWLRGNTDRLLREAIETQGSRLTGASVRVEQLALSARDGRGELHGLSLGNPPGFRTPYMLRVERVLLEVDPLSLAAPVVQVRRIAVETPDIIYERADGVTNIEAIQRHVAQQLGTSSESGEGKRLIVAAFDLTNARAQASAGFMDGKTVAIRLPDIHLRDIGKNQGGVTPGELAQIIASEMQRKLSGAYSFEKAVKSAKDALGKAGAAIKGLF